MWSDIFQSIIANIGKLTLNLLEKNKTKIIRLNNSTLIVDRGVCVCVFVKSLPPPGQVIPTDKGGQKWYHYHHYYYFLFKSFRSTEFTFIF